jgi:MFS family permease
VVMSIPISGELRESFEPRLGGARAWLVWSVATGFLVFLFSIQTGYAVTNLYIGHDLGLSVAQVGTVSAVYTWVFAICQFFGGPLLDRLGAGRVLPVCIGLVSLGTLLLGNAETFGMVLLAQAIFALGACCGFVGAGYVGGQWFGRLKFSFMFGLVQFAASMGAAFNMNLIGWFLGFLSWRELFNWAALIGLGLTILGAAMIRNPCPIRLHHDENGVRSFMVALVHKLLIVAAMPHLWKAALVGALTTAAFFWYGFVWGPRLLIQQGLSEKAAVFGVSLGWVGLGIGAVAFTKVSDVLGRRKLPLVFGTILQTTMALVILYLPSPGSGILHTASFLMGFGASACMLSYSTAADVVRPDQIGTSAAMINGFTFIFSGVLMSRVTLEGQSEIAIIAAVVAALACALLLRETYPSLTIRSP